MYGKQKDINSPRYKQLRAVLHHCHFNNLTAFGYETAILPSSILSTHTSCFKNFTIHDLSDEIPQIIKHWKNV